MLFFSSLAFSVLESGHKPRPLIVSLILPYVYILLLGVGFLGMTAIASLSLSIIFIHRVLQSMSDDQLVLLGRGWSLDRLSVILLHFGACRVCFHSPASRCHRLEPSIPQPPKGGVSGSPIVVATPTPLKKTKHRVPPQYLGVAAFFPLLFFRATPCSYWRDRSRIGGMSISERLRPQPYTCKWLVAFLP